MTRPVDLIPGFAPTREVDPQPDGTFIVYVTPPAMLSLPRVSVHLTIDQYYRYVEWRETKKLIQDALPDLSADDREKLMTGIGQADFDRIANDGDE